jgi:hypothetical protein
MAKRKFIVTIMVETDTDSVDAAFVEESLNQDIFEGGALDTIEYSATHLLSVSEMPPDE